MRVPVMRVPVMRVPVMRVPVMRVPVMRVPVMRVPVMCVPVMRVPVMWSHACLRVYTNVPPFRPFIGHSDDGHFQALSRFRVSCHGYLPDFSWCRNSPEKSARVQSAHRHGTERGREDFYSESVTLLFHVKV